MAHLGSYSINVPLHFFVSRTFRDARTQRCQTAHPSFPPLLPACFEGVPLDKIDLPVMVGKRKVN